MTTDAGVNWAGNLAYAARELIAPRSLDELADALARAGDAGHRVLPQSARPHWGKLSELPGADVTARYPRWVDFAALRARLDPERRFLNRFLERLGL